MPILKFNIISRQLFADLGRNRAIRPQQSLQCKYISCLNNINRAKKKRKKKKEPISSTFKPLFSQTIVYFYCADLIQSKYGLSEGSAEWDLCDQQNCSAWCQPALMTFMRMLSNKIMQCAMKVLCIHFMKDSLFKAVARHVSLTLMPYKYYWYIKLVLHLHISIICELVSATF